MLTALSIAGCQKKISTDDPGPLTFQVDLVAGEIGSAKDPIPFTHESFTLVFDVSAIDDKGEIATWFNDQVRVRVNPRGNTVEGQQAWFQVNNGVATNVEVALKDVHGTATVWFEHAASDEQVGHYATGLSPVITAVNPTIRNIQEVEVGKHQTSALRLDFVEVDLVGRTGIVTGVTNDGFYMTDLSEAGYEYSSMYVYNHSRPEVEMGDRLVQLNGTVDEFYGFTELGFPSWKLEGTAPMPDPIMLADDMVDLDDEMEKYESALVEIQNVTVCPMGEAFATYGQWVVSLAPGGSGCSSGHGLVNIVSAYTIIDLDPADIVGEVLPRITGNLRYHGSAAPNWIIYTRGPQDIDF